MRLRHLRVENFRGIASFDWVIPDGFICLIGPGDAGKTSILAAIELGLSRSWVQFSDADFFGADKRPIEIIVTIGDLPRSVLRDDKFGLDLRGWSSDGQLHDEPEDGDELVLSIRLQVDTDLEPSWHVVNDRNPAGKPISAKDRALLAPVRLGEDIDRQLTWSRGSTLARMSEDMDAVGSALLEINRSVRASVENAEIPSLKEAAASVGQAGIEFGAQIASPLAPGLDARSFSVGTAALGLHQQDGVSVRALGLGSRRLMALAIQHQVLGARAVTLVDEIEHGLEPHRLRHLLTKLHESGSQVIVTSHSPIVLAELGTNGITMVRRSTSGFVDAIRPDPLLQPAVRSMPEVLLGRRVIVAEGATEYGLLREMVEVWDAAAEVPLAWRGGMVVQGQGSSAPGRAAAFQELGFSSCYFGDSDVSITPSATDLTAQGVEVCLWPGGVSTEERIVLDAPEDSLEAFWHAGASALPAGYESAADQLALRLGHAGRPPVAWEEWVDLFGIGALRIGLAAAAKQGGWFKDIEGGRVLGRMVGSFIGDIPSSDLAATLEAARAWAYVD